MSDDPARRPERYASAWDLPSFRELDQQVRQLKSLALLRPGTRAQLRYVETELRRFGETVDRFYEVLGPRHWVFHNRLDPVAVAQALDSGTAEEVERAVIELQAETLRDHVRWLRMRPGIKERWHLLDGALDDYEAGRFTSTAHHVLAVMDGFVNDVAPGEGRRGLHARTGEEMEAWDSVVSHTMGLARVHEEVLSKGFRKLHTDEVFELYRNGIVHGTVVNFNNVVVAAKAWNYLFAVLDWAKAKEKAAEPPKPPTTWRGTLSSLQALGEDRRLRAAWQPRTLRSGDDGIESESAYEASTTYLTLWQQRNWGHMAEMVAWISGHHLAEPREVREGFQDQALTGFEIVELRHEAAGICIVEVELVVNEEQRHGTLRWGYQGEDGSALVEPQPGTWRLVMWDPDSLLDTATG